MSDLKTVEGLPYNKSVWHHALHCPFVDSFDLQPLLWKREVAGNKVFVVGCARKK